MISLGVITAPGCLAPFAVAHPPPAFDAAAFQACKNVVRSRLLSNQKHQCAYCERPLEDSGDSCHLDHVESQSNDSTRRFDIANLVASCQDDNTCGHAHGALSVPDALNPYLARNLHLAFECSGGELYPVGLAAEIARFAFENLKLNDPGLQTARNHLQTRLMQETIGLGKRARRRMRDYPTQGTGFRSLHYQVLGRFGFPEP